MLRALAAAIVISASLGAAPPAAATDGASLVRVVDEPGWTLVDVTGEDGEMLVRLTGLGRSGYWMELVLFQAGEPLVVFSYDSVEAARWLSVSTTVADVVTPRVDLDYPTSTLTLRIGGARGDYTILAWYVGHASGWRLQVTPATGHATVSATGDGGIYTIGHDFESGAHAGLYVGPRAEAELGGQLVIEPRGVLVGAFVPGKSSAQWTESLTLAQPNGTSSTCDCRLSNLYRDAAPPGTYVLERRAAGVKTDAWRTVIAAVDVVLPS